MAFLPARFCAEYPDFALTDCGNPRPGAVLGGFWGVRRRSDRDKPVVVDGFFLFSVGKPGFLSTGICGHPVGACGWLGEFVRPGFYAYPQDSGGRVFLLQCPDSRSAGVAYGYAYRAFQHSFPQAVKKAGKSPQSFPHGVENRGCFRQWRCGERGFAPCGTGVGGVPVPGGGQGGLPPRGTCSSCPGGEDHLKRRSSSPPVPPLLGCRHCLPVPRPNRHAPSGHRNAAQTPLRKGQSPTPGICLAGSVSAARVQPRGCKGRSPLHKKTFVLPLPAGKSALRARAGGISFPFGEGGQKIKLKAKSAGDRNRHAPAGHRNAAQTPPRKGHSPTPGICLAGSVSAARVQPRGCKGRSPLHKKPLSSPFPPGRGSGGWGQKNYDTYCKSGNRPAASWYARRPSERHLTRPALLFPFPPAQCGRDHPAPCAFPQHPGRKEWWSGHG